MARESEIWSWWKKATAGIDDLHQTRVENLSNRASPDVEGCVSGAAFTLETKVLHKLRKDGSGGTLKFEDGQREWSARRWRCGGAAYILVGVGPALFLIPGLFATSLPLNAVVEVADLRRRCIMARVLKMDRSARRDSFTAGTLLDLLRKPGLCRELADQIAAEHPALVSDARSPVQALLAAE